MIVTRTLRMLLDVVDMAEEMPGDYMKLFLSCDNHWNELGNLQAAKIIAAQFRSLVDGSGPGVSHPIASAAVWRQPTGWDH